MFSVFPNFAIIKIIIFIIALCFLKQFRANIPHFVNFFGGTILTMIAAYLLKFVCAVRRCSVVNESFAAVRSFIVSACLNKTDLRAINEIFIFYKSSKKRTSRISQNRESRIETISTKKFEISVILTITLNLGLFWVSISGSLKKFF